LQVEAADRQLARGNIFDLIICCELYADTTFCGLRKGVHHDDVACAWLLALTLKINLITPFVVLSERMTKISRLLSNTDLVK